jgi:hypothetical protein
VQTIRLVLEVAIGIGGDAVNGVDEFVGDGLALFDGGKESAFVGREIGLFGNVRELPEDFRDGHGMERALGFVDSRSSERVSCGVVEVDAAYVRSMRGVILRAGFQNNGLLLPQRRRLCDTKLDVVIPSLRHALPSP